MDISDALRNILYFAIIAVILMLLLAALVLPFFVKWMFRLFLFRKIMRFVKNMLKKG